MADGTLARNRADDANPGPFGALETRQVLSPMRIDCVERGPPGQRRPARMALLQPTHNTEPISG
jgi:hypothetical protein